MLNLKVNVKETTTGRAHDEMVITSRVSGLGRFILGRLGHLNAEDKAKLLDHLDSTLTELQDSLETVSNNG